MANFSLFHHASFFEMVEHNRSPTQMFFFKLDKFEMLGKLVLELVVTLTATQLV